MVLVLSSDTSSERVNSFDPVFNGDLSIGTFDKAREFVDKAILESFDSSKLWKELCQDSPHIYECIKDFILSDGKRLRPIFFYLFYRAFTDNVDLDKAKKTMAAMEIIHSFILIHDDIIDKSETRRSKKTLNCAFSSYLADRESASPVTGEDLALVAGDMLYAFAVDIFNQANFEPSLMSRIMSKLSETALMTAHGEFKEILGTLKVVGDIEENSIARIYDLKTGYYTFFGPASIAAMIADSAVDNTLIESFALTLGRAFQIHNDLAEIKELSEEHKVPKDFIEKKRTLPLCWAYQSSNSANRAKIDRFMNAKVVSYDEFLELRQIFIDRGIIEKAQKEIERLTKKALEIIMGLPANKEYLNFIKEYITQILK